MNTEEMIEKAKSLKDDRKVAGLVRKVLVDEIEKSGENYFESPRWTKHEETIKKAMKEETDRKSANAISNLLL